MGSVTNDCLYHEHSARVDQTRFVAQPKYIMQLLLSAFSRSPFLAVGDPGTCNLAVGGCRRPPACERLLCGYSMRQDRRSERAHRSIELCVATLTVRPSAFCSIGRHRVRKQTHPPSICVGRLVSCSICWREKPSCARVYTLPPLTLPDAISLLTVRTAVSSYRLFVY